LSNNVLFDNLTQTMPHDDIHVEVVDLHSHMLSGVDDGAKDFRETKQMLQLAYSEGCRHLFLTPHASFLEGQANSIANKLNNIRAWIKNEGMNLKIYFGTEIYVDPEDDEDIDSIIDKLQDGVYPTLNGTRYVLIEFYLGGFELNEVLPAVKSLIAAGYAPIIAHAEKYGVSFETLLSLKKIGCLFQMNLCDLYYIYENDINRMAHTLLRNRMIDFVGTDAHGMDRRLPKIKEYVEFLYKNYDKSYVDSILFNNAFEIFKMGR